MTQYGIPWASSNPIQATTALTGHHAISPLVTKPWSLSNAQTATPSTLELCSESEDDTYCMETHEFGGIFSYMSLSSVQPSETTRNILDQLFLKYQDWKQTSLAQPRHAVPENHDSHFNAEALKFQLFSQFNHGSTQAVSDGPSDSGSGSSTERGHGDYQESAGGSSQKRPIEEVDGDTSEWRQVTVEGDNGRKSMLHWRFACPFWKHDSNQWRDCFGYKLKRIRDVKQHLRRIHGQCCHCARCGQEFISNDQLDLHLVSIQPCDVRPFRRKWLSSAQKEELGTRYPNLTAEQQWYEVWNVVFPDQPKPDSPYIDSQLSEDLSSFVEFFLAQGPDIIQESGQARDTSLLPNTTRVAEREFLQMGFARIYDEWASARGQPTLQLNLPTATPIAPQPQPQPQPLTMTSPPTPNLDALAHDLPTGILEDIAADQDQFGLPEDATGFASFNDTDIFDFDALADEFANFDQLLVGLDPNEVTLDFNNAAQEFPDATNSTGSLSHEMIDDAEAPTTTRATRRRTKRARH
ncbi:hypothetical protein B0H63DRAFT_560718 [Podospora didyma]|uniref:C2H2-type domain-containing protein n=1 Tax=Podospora didyma TaxID=330526 RepID=A0AAE0TVA4_9PEZI|nr:hypothetical protein B0H63DRAFT_560718 [Podospora didyma]